MFYEGFGLDCSKPLCFTMGFGSDSSKPSCFTGCSIDFARWTAQKHRVLRGVLALTARNLRVLRVARCLVPDAWCPMPGARCLVPDAGGLSTSAASPSRSGARLVSACFGRQLHTFGPEPVAVGGPPPRRRGGVPAWSRPVLGNSYTLLALSRWS